MHWKLIIVLVSAFGIIKEFRPATPFLTPYLISAPKNFTNVQLYSEIYPFWTYSYLVALVPSFFLTDILRYKPIVITEAVALCFTWILLIWGKTIWQMQIMQIAFGVASACELGYESYMFLMVDKKYYKLVSSYTRAATLTGRFFAYALAQFLISFNYGSYLLLNQISFGAVCVIIPIAIAFPPITKEIIDSKVESQGKKAVDDMRQKETSEDSSDKTAKAKDSGDAKTRDIKERMEEYSHFILHELKIFKRNKNVLKWSIWWALTSCGFYQITNYVQSLWATMQIISDNFNGITECINTLIGAMISFSLQYINKDWTVHDELILSITSIIIAVLLIIMSQIKSVIIAYILYVIITAIYTLLMTAACATIASELNSASYGFVFGLNTFVALLLETAITFAFADKHGFALPIREQFLVYGGYFAIIALIFVIIICSQYIIRWWRNQPDNTMHNNISSCDNSTYH